MFSGIVETTAKVLRVVREEGTENVHLTLTAPFVDELKIDQSVAHNGVCLTVVAIDLQEQSYTVTAILETLERSNLGDLKEGDLVNLERSVQINGRLDGHIVQGHVDTTGTCTKVREADGSHYFHIEYNVPKEMALRGYMTVEKGSVCVNGVSLTVVNSTPHSFEVAIIPFTIEHTNFKELTVGKRVNLEFDIIGKYLSRIIEIEKQ
ncbi:riboflavin synthase [Porphyromonas levii]|uniref:riboflavin synthase n=1 Tax=Porphyromonas levii TaxID=28114 RepID=UPI001B8DA6D9|nr:riboflavin synthase [Porphyromonas levii]MBR8712648.1 Riboflavin synthase [Porphyromonas levii]MBR8714738.1 Riboflavin synthase [Porphyromonas levii]MBR8727222.1 Riboflavin synthase [Porphyromonas levii]MBR8735361.1 Riboflavin synthase [Porphyromonas levii]MBR8772930.1 Riboflavin synthase [Porphyromonas levii]